jgi:hypothetical protein
LREHVADEHRVAIDTASSGDHSHHDAIPTHHMMIKRRTDMRGYESRDGDTKQVMQHEKLLCEYGVLRLECII